MLTDDLDLVATVETTDLRRGREVRQIGHTDEVVGDRSALDAGTSWGVEAKWLAPDRAAREEALVLPIARRSAGPRGRVVG